MRLKGPKPPIASGEMCGTSESPKSELKPSAFGPTLALMYSSPVLGSSAMPEATGMRLNTWVVRTRFVRPSITTILSRAIAKTRFVPGSTVAATALAHNLAIHLSGR